MDQLAAVVRAFFQRHWADLLRLRERLHFSEDAFHLLLAGGVGVLGGLTNLAYKACNGAIEWLVMGQTGDPAEIAAILPDWARLVVPAVGGLAAGLVLYWGFRLVGKQGSSNLLEVVVAGDGRLPFRTAIIKAGSSLLSISTGGSIGREGLITQLSATLASKWGQLAGWQPYRLRLLVACGAASGIAAAYNAPVAGAVFAAQIVLGNFSMNLFAPLVFASVVATMVSRSFFGIDPWYQVPAFDFTRLSQLPWFVCLGGLSGLLGAGFLKALRESENWFGKQPVPLYARMAVGGLCVGAISLLYPEVWGNGYTATNHVLHQERLTLWYLTGLVAAKFLATLATVGSGAVGGVFTPTLFLGAGLGSAFGALLHLIHWAQPLPLGAFAIVGMGSMLAATTHSPLLAMIMVFEISLDYSIMPPLMVACVVATLVTRRLRPESVYTEPLRQKGLDTDRESAQIGAATQITVGDVMRAPVPPIREVLKFRQIADRFLTGPNNFLPVVDAEERLLGVVALHDMKEYLSAGQELSAVIAFDLMRPPPPCLTPNQRLLDALPILLTSELRNVPVVNSLTQRRLVGAIARAEALGMLSEAIAARGAARE